MTASRADVAGFVVDYWRDYFAAVEAKPRATAAGTAIGARHALGCVASALLGETDPNELGIGEERLEDFRRVVERPVVELDLEIVEARALLERLPRVEGSVTDRARSPLFSAIRKIEAELEPASVVGRFLEGFRAGVQRAQERQMAPRWEWLRPAIAAIDATVKSEPQYVAHADAIGAYVRDTFDALGLSVRDGETLYVALVTASTIVELAANGHGRGVVDDATLEAIAKISQSLAAAVIPFLPDEAKP